MMRWRDLLSTKRLGQRDTRATDDWRSPFEIDVDRFVFSSAFRRLQAKMQVHGPSLDSTEPGDYVRNRLTHSIEVSRVGRSLGQLAGQHLIRHCGVEGVTPADIGHIVLAGSISHDVGQTPFSHEGEQAIASWWAGSDLGAEILSGLPEEMRWELCDFEGNAFGFRLLTRLEGWQPDGGLQLTAATLGAFSKYPWSGGLPPEARPIARKYGIFTSELALFREVAAATGLIETAKDVWCRHPLAYLTEAADDICYLIVDIEDAVQVGALSFAEAEELLAPMAAPEPAVYCTLEGVVRRLTYLRARAIATLLTDASEVWAAQHDRMLGGEPVPELLAGSRFSAELTRIAEVSRRKIYRGGRRPETVLISSNTLSTLLDGYAATLLRRERTADDGDLSLRDRAVFDVFCRARGGAAPVSRERRAWVTDLMDHIASLTDRAALAEAKTLAGPVRR
jgi:dGTPase